MYHILRILSIIFLLSPYFRYGWTVSFPLPSSLGKRSLNRGSREWNQCFSVLICNRSFSFSVRTPHPLASLLILSSYGDISLLASLRGGRSPRKQSTLRDSPSKAYSPTLPSSLRALPTGSATSRIHQPLCRRQRHNKDSCSWILGSSYACPRMTGERRGLEV
jgi:hypothetical protein